MNINELKEHCERTLARPCHRAIKEEHELTLSLINAKPNYKEQAEKLARAETKEKIDKVLKLARCGIYHVYGNDIKRYHYFEILHEVRELLRGNG